MRLNPLCARLACLVTLLLAGSCLLDVSVEPVAGVGGGVSGVIDARRSLAVTDQIILQRFSFQRVLEQLVAQSGVRITALELFQQWWDILNPAPGLGRGPHCDDVRDPELGPVLNGFPYACRSTSGEGAQATCDPFAANSRCAYIPIGLFNRFDLMPESGAHCGEYNIVFAKLSDLEDPEQRSLVMFEAVLPNPAIALGVEGCRAVVEAWAWLSSVDDPLQRADALERLYFRGLPSAVPPVAPVLHVDHFGAAQSGWGQVRTNQISPRQQRGWSMREFKLKRGCGASRCDWLRFAPAPNKANAYAPLFGAEKSEKRTRFQAYLPGQVATLIRGGPSEIYADIPGVYNSGSIERDYLVHFGPGPSPLHSALQSALEQQDARLTPDQVVARLQALSCAGCHRDNAGEDLGDGLLWPASLGHSHISATETELGEGGQRYKLSQGLLTTYLPHREQLLERYLAGVLPKATHPHRAIGGFQVH